MNIGEAKRQVEALVAGGRVRRGDAFAVLDSLLAGNGVTVRAATAPQAARPAARAARPVASAGRVPARRAGVVRAEARSASDEELRAQMVSGQPVERAMFADELSHREFMNACLPGAARAAGYARQRPDLSARGGVLGTLKGMSS